MGMGSLCWGDENIRELVAMEVRLCECTKCHRVVHFKGGLLCCVNDSVIRRSHRSPFSPAWFILYVSSQRLLHQARPQKILVYSTQSSGCPPCAGDGSVWSLPCGASSWWRMRGQTLQGAGCVTGCSGGHEPSGGRQRGWGWPLQSSGEVGPGGGEGEEPAKQRAQGELVHRISKRCWKRQLPLDLSYCENRTALETEIHLLSLC